MSGVEKLAEVLASRKSLKDVVESQHQQEETPDSESDSEGEAEDEGEQQPQLTQPTPQTNSLSSTDLKKKKKRPTKKRAKDLDKPSVDDRSDLKKSVIRILDLALGGFQDAKPAVVPNRKRNNYKGPTFAGVSSKILGFKKMPEVGTDAHKLVSAKFKDEKDKWDTEHPSKATKRRLKKLSK